MPITNPAPCPTLRKRKRGLAFADRLRRLLLTNAARGKLLAPRNVNSCEQSVGRLGARILLDQFALHCQRENQLAKSCHAARRRRQQLKLPNQRKPHLRQIPRTRLPHFQHCTHTRAPVSDSVRIAFN